MQNKTVLETGIIREMTKLYQRGDDTIFVQKGDEFNSGLLAILRDTNNKEYIHEIHDLAACLLMYGSEEIMNQFIESDPSFTKLKVYWEILTIIIIMDESTVELVRENIENFINILHKLSEIDDLRQQVFMIISILTAHSDNYYADALVQFDIVELLQKFMLMK